MVYLQIYEYEDVHDREGVKEHTKFVTAPDVWNSSTVLFDHEIDSYDHGVREVSEDEVHEYRQRWIQNLKEANDVLKQVKT